MAFSTPFTPPYASPADTGQLTANQIAFSSYTINNANDFLGQLSDSVKTDAVTLDTGDFANPAFATASLGPLNTLLNLFASLQMTRPTITPITGEPPQAPTMVPVPVAPPIFPTFTANAPTLNMPTAPSSILPSAPSAPALAEIVLPVAPTYSLPVAPTFDAITLPTPPSIPLPVFSSTLPVETLIVPTNTFSWYEAAYSSSLLDAAKAKLLDNIQNGGYGIDTTDEAALVDRERARQMEMTAAQIDEIYRSAAGRGFPLPPGDLNVAVQRAMQDAYDKLSTVSRDIYLKRADLYVENRKFTITEARALETVLIGYHSSVQERSLNAAKAVLQLGIEIFNASVARYNAQLDAYKTEASVFESKIRAALAQIEIYRVQMDGKRIELAVQTQRVELYRAQLAGVNAVIDIYKTQVQAQAEVANIQRLKTEAFRAQIEAYAAQVQSKVAEAQVFEARVRGEVARVNAFEGQVRAFAAQVDATKAQSDTLLGNLRLQTEQFQAQARVYEAAISGYRAGVDKQAEYIRAQLSEYQTDASVYSTKGNLYAEAARVGVSQVDLEGRMRFKALDIVIENARSKLEALKSSANINVAKSGLVEHYITAAVASAIGSLNAISATTKQT